MMKSTIVGGAMLPACPAILHHAGYRGSAGYPGSSRCRRRYRGRLRALNPDLWIYSQRPCGAILSSHSSALHYSCWRRSVGHLRRSEIPLEGSERDRPSRSSASSIDRISILPFSSTAKIDYAIGIPLTHIGHTDPVLPIYGQCLSAAPADYGAVLRLRAGSRPHSHHARAQDSCALERRHVPLPRHRPLFQSGAFLGQARAGKAQVREI